MVFNILRKVNELAWSIKVHTHSQYMTHHSHLLYHQHHTNTWWVQRICYSARSPQPHADFTRVDYALRFLKDSFRGMCDPLAFEERGVFFKERNAAIRQRIEQLFLTFILIFSYIYIRSRISDNYDTVTEKEILGPQVCLRKGSI